jgi:hypothetical protein
VRSAGLSPPAGCGCFAFGGGETCPVWDAVNLRCTSAAPGPIRREQLEDRSSRVVKFIGWTDLQDR